MLKFGPLTNQDKTGPEAFSHWFLAFYHQHKDLVRRRECIAPKGLIVEVHSNGSMCHLKGLCMVFTNFTSIEMCFWGIQTVLLMPKFLFYRRVNIALSICHITTICDLLCAFVNIHQYVRKHIHLNWKSPKCLTATIVVFIWFSFLTFFNWIQDWREQRWV